MLLTCASNHLRLSHNSYLALLFAMQLTSLSLSSLSYSFSHTLLFRAIERAHQGIALTPEDELFLNLVKENLAVRIIIIYCVTSVHIERS